MANETCSECGGGPAVLSFQTRMGDEGPWGEATYFCAECAPATGGMDRFDVVWARVCRSGDTASDYHRLRSEWEDAGKPVPVTDFVRNRGLA